MIPFPSRRAALAGLLSLPALAQEKKKNSAAPYPPQMDGAATEVYKKAGGVELKLWIFRPAGHTPSKQSAAIVFFFGGGWTSGTPKQFEQHCLHLASKGMVAITADYRVASRHKVKVVDCVRDAKSAIRYVRTNAKRLGIDANRIAAGGGSAGGHLAAATALLPGYEEQGENTGISSRPNALVLFNPAVILADAAEADFKVSSLAGVTERMGAAPETVSPYHHVGKGAPAAIVFHGQADTTVPYRTVEAFARKMKQAGNRCELAGYEGQAHGFFNYGRGNNEYFEKTRERMTEFLKGLGYTS
ncbi:MAG: alpha/beta hydrolase [Bryobacterales bacterium]|nr:alpha/beta hydrolase [Bryobacterales bacterium]